MAELTQADVVYSRRSLQLWKTLVNCLAFFYQIFLQILRAVGYHPLLSSSADGFKPLPNIELLETAADSPASVEIESSIEVERSRFERLKARFQFFFFVVLDLDETLVCAYETSSLPAALLNGKPKINYVTVFERPGLHDFLEQLSHFADLVLFTAGLEGYARPLVDRIDTRKVLSNRLYRPSTVSTQYRDHVKDLLSTSTNMSRTVIVDNNPFSFLLQPSNGIPCVAFSAGQPNDTQLLDVILPLLKQLSEEEDVRRTLYDRFHMPEWFQKQGIPTSCWNP
ncbi:hypothetical protein HID58_071260 [Brassica napus]|uniref:FCP1 homology domain-containing protein n=1 Tax=Brassica napus TaxID=3708 RepID=A0ABQ7Z166_BRANA|nr:hypothetical protein HID58_071260 [Brassica napus]